jgi:glycosidase
MSSRTFRVFFRFSSHFDTRSVEVVADWNGWKKNALSLKDTDGDLVWDAIAELPSGVYHYKFLVDGTRYVLDPDNPEQEQDSDGNWNSVLQVGDACRRGDVIVEIGSEDTVSAKSVRVRAAYDRRKFSHAILVATVNDQPLVIPGVVLYEDEIYAWTIFRVERPQDLSQFLYYIELRQRSGASRYFGQSGLCESEWEVESFEYVRPATRLETPAWVTDAVFYQIFPDRFANGDPSNDPPGTLPPDAAPKPDSFFGGDLDGIARKADYLASLGVNALYLTPVFESVSPHKYDASDYRKVDSHFGGDEAFDRMAAILREKGIRFILDGVFNHSGTAFPAFRDITEKGAASKYLDWYHVRKFPLMENGKPNYDCWWSFPNMPEFNEDNPEVIDYHLGTAEYWIKRGTAGWRLDVPFELKHSFWKLFRTRVKAVDPEAYLLGEIWRNAKPWLTGDEFDAVMNYHFRDACIHFFALRKINAEEFSRSIGKQIFEYPLQASFAALNFLSTHDTARFFSVAGKDVRRVKLALAFLFTAIGAPCIYYGDEVGMAGGRDPDNRRFMQWDVKKQDLSILETCRQLIRTRKENRVLRRGEMRFILAEEGVVGFERYASDDRLLVFINNSDENAHIDVTRFFGNGDFTDLGRGADLKRKKAFTLGSNEYVILKKTKER